MLAVNHTAYLDFMEVGLVGRNSGRNVRYMMKAELEHGIVGWLMKHCKAIGVDRSAGAQSYRQAVGALRGKRIVESPAQITVSLPVVALLPGDYIADERLRLRCYQELAQEIIADETAAPVVDGGAGRGRRRAGGAAASEAKR